MESSAWPRLVAMCVGGLALFSSPVSAETWSGSFVGTSGPQWIYKLDVLDKKVSIRAWGELNGARYPIVCDQSKLDASGNFQTTCQHVNAGWGTPLSGVRFGLKARLTGTSATMSYVADNGGKASLNLEREVAELVRPDNVVTNNARPPAATSARPLATPAPQAAPPSGPSVTIKPPPAPETRRKEVAEAVPVPPKPDEKKVEVEKPKPVEDKIALKPKEPEPPQPKKETVDSIVDSILSEDARTKSQNPAAQSDGLRKEAPSKPELSGQTQARGDNTPTSKPTLSKTTPAPATVRVDISDLNIPPKLCGATILFSNFLGIGEAHPVGTFCEFAVALREALKQSNEQLLPLQAYTSDNETLVGLPMRQRGSDDVTCVFRDVRGDLVLEGALDERSHRITDHGTANCLIALGKVPRLHEQLHADPQWATRIAGQYSGGRITLHLQNETPGHFVGGYVDATTEKYDGRIFDCSIVQTLVVKCKWTDKFGAGPVEISFKPDMKEFSADFKKDSGSTAAVWTLSRVSAPQ